MVDCQTAKDITAWLPLNQELYNLKIGTDLPQHTETMFRIGQSASADSIPSPAHATSPLSSFTPDKRYEMACAIWEETAKINERFRPHAGDPVSDEWNAYTVQRYRALNQLADQLIAIEKLEAPTADEVSGNPNIGTTLLSRACLADRRPTAR